MKTRGVAARRLMGAPRGVPLYADVKRRIMEGIIAGEWRPGEALPSETALAERFSVAMGTLRKAVDELQDENIVVRQQGRGTFVATHDEDRFRFHFFHIAPRGRAKVIPGVALLSFRKGRATREESAGLGISRGDTVVRFRNLLSIAGARVVVDDITVAQALFPTLTDARLAGRPGTVYQLYQSAFGITVVRSTERLRAALAPQDVAAALGVTAGTPLLEIQRVAFTFKDRPVEVRRSLVDTREHEYVSDLRDR